MSIMTAMVELNKQREKYYIGQFLSSHEKNMTKASTDMFGSNFFLLEMRDGKTSVWCSKSFDL